jgi:hypothetical protein
MPQLLVTLLGAVLAALVLAGVVVLVVTLLRRWRRRTGLAKLAGDLGFRYSREDPLGLSRRCAEFALVAGGHSPVAFDVITGHVDGVAVRAFDFQYEVGHGVRRMVRRYGVVLLESDWLLPRLTMWHNRDFPPIPARQSSRTRGAWILTGDAKRVDDFLAVCEPWFSDGGCVETNGQAVLLAAPGEIGRNGFPPLPEIVRMVRPMLM